jgi:hypothetical protein
MHAHRTQHLQISGVTNRNPKRAAKAMAIVGAQ